MRPNDNIYLSKCVQDICRKSSFYIVIGCITWFRLIDWPIIKSWRGEITCTYIDPL